MNIEHRWSNTTLKQYELFAAVTFYFLLQSLSLSAQRLCRLEG